jgi:phenylpyruvate C(3)-methyltransferase
VSDSQRRVGIPVPVPVEPIAVDAQSHAHVRDLMAADTFNIVNGFALAQAIFALGESPLLAEVERDGLVRAGEAASAHGLDPRHTVGLLRYLATQDLFKEEEGQVFWLTPRGRAALSPGSLGWIRVFVGGYGPLMRTAPELLTRTKVHGRDVERDPFFVATGSSMVTGAVCDEAPYRVIERYRARTVADLGCGAGRFLIEWARRHPEHRGVGVDIAPRAIEVCGERASSAGVGDRVRFVVGDGFDLSGVARECSDVDLFYSFAMEHEVMRSGEQAVLDHIDQMAELFPGKRYLMGEPLLYMAPHDGKFYWVHMLSHQGLPRDIPGWCQLLVRLKKAALERVYVPEHQKIGAYFDIRL